MGERVAAVVDTAALSGTAAGYDAVADALDAAVADRSHGPRFDGATAGAAHVADGDAVRAALDELTGVMSRWARAAGEIAAQIRSSAGRYADADDYAATRLG